MSFTTLGATASLTITDADVDRDRVVYNGTAASDVFRVPDSGGIPAPSLELTSQLGVGTTGIEAYVLRGLGGDDRSKLLHRPTSSLTSRGTNRAAATSSSSLQPGPRRSTWARRASTMQA